MLKLVEIYYISIRFLREGSNTIQNTKKPTPFFLARNHLQEVTLMASTVSSIPIDFEEEMTPVHASQIFQNKFSYIIYNILWRWFISRKRGGGPCLYWVVFKPSPLPSLLGCFSCFLLDRVPLVLFPAWWVNYSLYFSHFL